MSSAQLNNKLSKIILLRFKWYLHKWFKTAKYVLFCKNSLEINAGYEPGITTAHCLKSNFFRLVVSKCSVIYH